MPDTEMQPCHWKQGHQNEHKPVTFYCIFMMRMQCYPIIAYGFYKSSDKSLQAAADLGDEGRVRRAMKRGDEEKEETELGKAGGQYTDVWGPLS